MDRFWSKVDMSGGPDACWPWTASRNKDGYGKFKIRGSVQNASRVAWELRNGEYLFERVARHTCDNPWCCNPTHIVAGTQADNMQDRSVRGRVGNGAMLGVDNPRAKLTERQVLEIRKRIEAGENNRQIAKDYPVSDSLVSRIRTGRSWANGGS